VASPSHAPSLPADDRIGELFHSMRYAASRWAISFAIWPRILTRAASILTALVFADRSARAFCPRK
jgi:hypothetical protein